jgi:signal transduction histidine kinase
MTGAELPLQVVDLSSMELRNMRERASLIGGKFNILSIPGKGTRITVTVSKDMIPQKR